MGEMVECVSSGKGLGTGENDSSFSSLLLKDKNKGEKKDK